MENNTNKEYIPRKKQWCRFLYMMLFGFALYMAMMILGLVVFVQLIFALLTGEPNHNLRQFGADLSRYITQVTLFLTYNENRRPYPFNPFDETVENEDDELADVDREDSPQTIRNSGNSDDTEADKPTVAPDKSSH